MKPSIAIFFACIFALHLSKTVAYSASMHSPPVLFALPSLQFQSSAMQTSIEQISASDIDDIKKMLVMKSVFGRVYRRGKRLLTLDKEDTTTTKKKQKEPEQLWRVVFHNSEYTPDSVSRILTKVFPITRMTAYDICIRARSAGTVVVVVTDKKQAEKYCGALGRRGLMANIEPHSNSED